MPEPGPGLWHIDASENTLLLRKPGRDGATLRTDNLRQLPGTLRLVLEQTGAAPERFSIRVRTSEQYKSVTAWSESLAERNISLEVYLDEQTQGAWLARQPLPDARSSLLTGSFAVKQTGWKGPGRLKTSLALASAVLVITMVHWFIQGARLQKEYDQLTQAMEQTYRQVFPDAVNIVDPRYQMEQELSRLRSAGTTNTGSSFLQRLDALAQVLSVQPDCRLQQISFDGSSIVLEVSVADYESFERLQQQLGQVASISVENAELKDGRVQGRIRAGGKA
jgi:type II secretion system protein L